MSIHVKELAFVFHSVTDIPRAREFYEKFLGLKVGVNLEFTPGVWWIEYDIAGVALAICNGLPGERQSASSVTLEVADLDQSLKAARAANILVSKDVMEFPPCRMFAVKDPDGNEIGLHQRKAISPS